MERESPRAAMLRHVVTIRERLSKHYRDDALWNALSSLEEAVLVSPVEAERAAIAEQLCDAADEYERNGDAATASALVTQADEVLKRGGGE